jgi:hypothetical protein
MSKTKFRLVKLGTAVVGIAALVVELGAPHKF